MKNMKKLVELNRPALWRPIRSEETSIRKYSGGYPYQTSSGIVANSTMANPVVRYARNFTKFKQDFSLFMFTNETDMEKVEKFFVALVGKLKKADITKAVSTANMSNFTYLETCYGGKE